MPRALCIAGMPRSGTSATARVLNLLGLDLGAPGALQEAHPKHNPTGYWEYRAIVALQQGMMNDLGHESFGSEPLPADWLTRSEVGRCAERLEMVIARDFAGRETWGWKDPRTCILIPMWQRILARLQTDLHFLIVVRDPRHVAASLQVLGEKPDSSKYQLAWHYYMLSALVHSRGYPRGFVSYQALLEDWRRAVGEALEAARVRLPGWESTDASSRIGDFLEPSLERSARIAGSAWAAPFVEESFELVSRFANGTASSRDDSRATQLLEEYEQYGRALVPAALAEARATIWERESEIAALRAHLDSMERSLSWRITGPARRAGGLMKRVFRSGS